MILTENINVSDSVLFLVAARIALSYILEESAIEDKDYVKSFLVNEASDYQIMSLLVREDLPEEKFNEVEELLLFSELKELIVENYELVSEFVEPDIIKNFIFEVSSIYPEFSSAYPILEFQAGVEREAYFDELKKPSEYVKGAIKTAGKYWAGKAKKVGAVVKDIPGDIKKGVAGVKRAGKLAAAKRAPKLAGPYPTRPGAAKAGPAAFRKARPHGLATRVGTAAATAGKAVTKFAGTTAGKAVGGGALAALALYASYKIYKRFLSKAARACKGMGGADKSACMKKYKVSALNAQIKSLSSAGAKCSKSKDPAKCKAGIQKKVAGLKAKAAKAAA